MTPELSSADLLRIMRSVRLGYPLADGSLGMVEKCGLLRGRGHRVTRMEETANVSCSPLDSFEIAPAALIRAYRLARKPNGLQVLGFFHTHPSGLATPSVRDAEAAAPDGMLWVIAGRDGVLVWRAVENGAMHGRFDRVSFDLRTGSRVEKGCLGVQWRGLELGRRVRFELEARGEI